MSSRKAAGGKPSGDEISSTKGKGKSVDQLSQGVSDVNLGSFEDGEWEVYSKKSKNRAGGTPKSWVPQNSSTKAWAPNNNNGRLSKAPSNSWSNADAQRPAGRGYSRAQPSFSDYVAASAPPRGMKWSDIVGSAQSTGPGCQARDETISNTNSGYGDADDDDGEEEVRDEDDDMDNTDNELLSDEFDSDSSQRSHDSRKKSKWFCSFFEILDKLTVEEINEPERQWHCPACQGGPGAIDWYRGLQPLMTHAKTKGSKRVPAHRELARLLEEELHRRGTSVIPSGEVFGKWKGLTETVKDHEIVWPPMVVIRNTRLEQDENDKWVGMGNQELLDYFNSYAASRARHSYGPQGHRGMSVLIFEDTARGYLEAERLHKHFAEQGTDRDAWDRRRVLHNPGGKRQLYGYMATKEDMDFFNRHCQSKTRLKFEIRSYHETVVSQINQMSEENQQLIWFQNKYEKEQMRRKAVEESFGVVTEKLRKTTEENRIVRQRTKMQHEQNKEEMDYQEKFFKELNEAREAKENNFEKLQQEEREKVKQNPSSMGDCRLKTDEIAAFVKIQDKEMEEFVAERDKLVEVHEEKRIAMKKSHWQEKVELEKQFDDELNQLMEKYTPDHFNVEPSNKQ